MSDRKIYGQLIALTKEVKLRKVGDGTSGLTQFIPGGNAVHGFGGGIGGGIGITWWYTKKAFELCRIIASMAISKHVELRYGDIEELSKVVRKTLEQNCLDQKLFNPNDVFLSNKENLFEARSTQEVESFTRTLWNYLFDRFKASIVDWCIIYPLPRIKTSSFNLNHDGILIINKEDIDFWNSYVAETYDIGGWNPQNGLFSDGLDTIFSKLKYESLLICICKGTAIGARFDASLKFRKFLSILFSIFSDLNSHALIKSSAEPFRVCIQFPKIESIRRESSVQSHIGDLIPYFIMDYNIESNIENTARSWYSKQAKSNDEKRSRSDKGAHFINHAMNSEDTESYMNYFISLDSLFGERGKVEESIIEGVKNLLKDETLIRKTKWLFELRSELVHGGSRFIQEWNKYERYRSHFKSLPSYDLEKLAFRCLLNYCDQT